MRTERSEDGITGAIIDGVGCWFERLSGYIREDGPAIFLDRDGVVVEEVQYLSRPQDVRLVPQAADAIAKCNAAGVTVIVITNQAGVGRGYYGWSAFQAVEREVRSQLANRGARIDAVLACAYHENGLGPYQRANHSWRKPNPGMILHAHECFHLNLQASAVIGDSLSDLQAGISAKLPIGGLVLTGYGRLEAGRLANLDASGMETFVFRNVREATWRILLRLDRRM